MRMCAVVLSLEATGAKLEVAAARLVLSAIREGVRVCCGVVSYERDWGGGGP